jgi:hypothetical protein
MQHISRLPTRAIPKTKEAIRATDGLFQEYCRWTTAKPTVGVSRSPFRQVDFSSRKIHPENCSRRLQ